MTGAIHAVATIIGSQVVLVSFGILFGGGVLGIAIGQMLPKHHLGEETLAMVRAAMGTLSILSALVLGFLINSAKTKFESVSVQIEQFASDLTILDRELRHLGPVRLKRATFCGATRPPSSLRSGRRSMAVQRLMIRPACS